MKLTTQQGIVFFLTTFLFSGCGVSGDDGGAKPCENIPSDEWTLLGLKEESVTSIAVHPEKAGVIYAGTASNFSDGREGKLFKTMDCGETWEVIVVGGSFREIELSPDDPSIVYAVNGGILKSVDGGKNWQPSWEGIERGSVASLAIDPQTPQILYAGTSGNFGGSFYKSTDGGASWKEIEGIGLEENWLRSGVTSIAIDPANPKHVFAGTAWRGDVLRSTDGGQIWETTTLFDTGSIVHALIIDPSHTQDMYAGLNKKGLYNSQDGGKTWSLVTNEFLADTISVVELGNDHQNNALYALTTYEDTGSILKSNLSMNTWETVSAPVNNQSFYYSTFKIYVIQGQVYQFMGLSGIYIKKLEN